MQDNKDNTNSHEPENSHEPLSIKREPLTPNHENGKDSDGGIFITKSLKVIVIDDSKTIRQAATTLLKKTGYDVITATDGFNALAKIAEFKPDIIFVDIMMPRLDGYQTCALIKNNQKFKHIPVIMMSSKAGVFDRAKGRLAGSDCHLIKPFSRDELLGTIQNHCPRLARAI